MRYYRIEISDQNTGRLLKLFTNRVNNAPDPGALMVELDISAQTFAIPYGNPYVRIWGIQLQDITQAFNFSGRNIKVFGGMQKGLPLANPNQASLLVSGTIIQAFGNWVGTDMTLDILIGSASGAPDNAKNIALNWQAGTPLADALSTTLKTAFPKLTQTININPKLVLNNVEPGFYQSLAQFSQYVKGISRSIIGGDYGGVEMTLKENAIVVYDGSSVKAPKQIAFTDLVGQPTWVGPFQVQIRTVMRGDLYTSDYIKLPPTLVTVAPGNFFQNSPHQPGFQGTFQIDAVRHVGSSRSLDANSWISNFDVHPVPG